MHPWELPPRTGQCVQPRCAQRRDEENGLVPHERTATGFDHQVLSRRADLDHPAFLLVVVPFNEASTKGLIVGVDRAPVDAKDTRLTFAIDLGLRDLEVSAWLELGVTIYFDREFLTPSDGDPGICANWSAVDGLDHPNRGDDFPEEGSGGSLGYCLAVGSLAVLLRRGPTVLCVKSLHN